MNESEVIMRYAKPTHEFIAHTKAFEAAGKALALTSSLPANLRSLADQVVRSASSVPAISRKGRGEPEKTALTTGG